MTGSIEGASLKDRLEHLVKVVSSQHFLTMQSIGNEVPFYICPYPVEEAVEIERLQGQVISKLAQKKVIVHAINLYNLSVEMLIERGIWIDILRQETELEKDELKELLQNVLDPEVHLIPAIENRLQGEKFDVLFLTGVGEVFPYLRSHNILNNLQRAAKDHPSVFFFPGSYTHNLETGASLKLFDKLLDDKYYRAFNINTQS